MNESTLDIVIDKTYNAIPVKKLTIPYSNTSISCYANYNYICFFEDNNTYLYNF
jgi:hypothetical protein